MTTLTAEDVRVVTTIGHVDHGKTTFVDYLLAANNIISARMAGKIRYMDSREDEQQRGITMESSAVSLRFKMLQKLPEGETSPKTYVVNLIDTPGHVDFSSEVSTASRLCDGALLLVDVVEGVCTQTTAVLRQAWIDRVRPILVINKVDRLITELKLSPLEAYQHLSKLIEQVNAVMGVFFASERMEDDQRWHEDRERRLAEKKERHADETDATVNSTDEFQERDDEDIYFAPERGNVIFASAVDGWGFRVGHFAQLYAVKMGMKEANLRRALWGDFYLDPKTKRVISYKHLRGRALKPLFVQFVLDNIWAVYDSVSLNPDSAKIQKIVTTLNLKISPRDLNTKDPKHLLTVIFGQWLSLSTCTIQTVVDVIPAPSIAQRTRVPKMLHPDLNESTVEPLNKLEKNLYSCDSGSDAYVTALVSKMFAVSKKDLPENKRKPLTAQEMRERGREAREAKALAASTDGDAAPTATKVKAEGETDETTEAEGDQACLLGFARVYSGTVRVGMTLYCVLPKYSGSEAAQMKASKSVVTATVDALYIMMGRDLVPVDSVKAGNVFAVRGLEGKVWRTATLCAPGEGGIAGDPDTVADKDCLINLGGMTVKASPIVRVALEPVEPADMPRLLQGLKILSQSDPCVETFQQQTGEHVILTAGELHLERCLKDLRERFAKVEIQASKPIVPFRETAVKAIDMAAPKTPNSPRGTIFGQSARSIVTFTLRALPLPEALSMFLLNNFSLIRSFRRERDRKSGDHAKAEDEDEEIIAEEESQGTSGEGADEIARRPTAKTSEAFWDQLKQICQQAGGEWSGVDEKVWALGSQSAGGCMLIDARKGGPYSTVRLRSHQAQNGQMKGRYGQEFENCVETGFEIASYRGPLCAEPVQGMAYFVESVDFDEPAVENESALNRMAQITGSLIAAVKEACGAAMLDWSPRLMLAMYSCEIQASTDVLGRVYGVVAKRRGRIVSEEMKEGMSFFTVKALLPVVESFGFADEIRKRTSGAASPQLIFHGYEMLDQDPFWVPTTEEELEDLGDKADRRNVAKDYMDAVRERKGMFVDKKIIEHAEKQRTLKR